MKCMNRNKVPFYYALYKGRNEVKDDYGNRTGEYEVVYDNPVSCKANISSASGVSEVNVFGVNLSYDKVIVLEDTSIDEYSILWIDVVPEINEDGSTDTPHDYIVKKVAKSLNNVLIAVSKVQVNG